VDLLKHKASIISETSKNGQFSQKDPKIKDKSLKCSIKLSNGHIPKPNFLLALSVGKRLHNCA
jgi:hypothetical protein